MKIKNTFAIGCLVQWYEIEQIGEYIESVKQSLNQLENPNFIINFATFIAFLIIVMVVINIYDYIKLMLPFWRIERRYKKELESLRKK